MPDIEWLGLALIMLALVFIHGELKDIHELLSMIEAKQPHPPKEHFD